MIHVGSRCPRNLHRGARKLHLLCKGGRPVYVSNEAAKAGAEEWLRANVETGSTWTEDATGRWFDVAVTLPSSFSGSPATGWTDGTIHLGLFYSQNLVAWSGAGNGWSDIPGMPMETLPGGLLKRWHARHSIPMWWINVMVDYSAASDRYGKSITGITIAGNAVSLPAYPYSLPSEAAAMQADLRATGYTGATVTTSTAPIVATAKNHTPSGAQKLDITMSGSNVSAVHFQGSLVSLPAYPYAMPAAQSSLQTALRAAGFSGAVVMLHAGEWSIVIPNHPAVGSTRDFTVFIDPGDPYPQWNMYGEYQGLNSAAAVLGSPSNTRDPFGNPLNESLKGFCRIGFTNIPALP